MTGVNPKNFHASMYTFYFLCRRFLTGLLLVVCVEFPMFQCAILLIFATSNFIYLTSVKPMASKKENAIELFNEFCIIICAHLYNIFLRGDGNITFVNSTGWAFIGVTGANILGNLSIVFVISIKDGCSSIVEKC